MAVDTKEDIEVAVKIGGEKLSSKTAGATLERLQRKGVLPQEKPQPPQEPVGKPLRGAKAAGATLERLQKKGILSEPGKPKEKFPFSIGDEEYFSGEKRYPSPEARAAKLASLPKGREVISPKTREELTEEARKLNTRMVEAPTDTTIEALPVAPPVEAPVSEEKPLVAEGGAAAISAAQEAERRMPQEQERRERKAMERIRRNIAGAERVKLEEMEEKRQANERLQEAMRPKTPTEMAQERKGNLQDVTAAGTILKPEPVAKPNPNAEQVIRQQVQQEPLQPHRGVLSRFFGKILGRR